MKTSTQITLGVSIGAGILALHREDTLAAFLAFTSASAMYFAWEEAEAEKKAAPSSAIVGYLEKLQKGLI